MHMGIGKRANRHLDLTLVNRRHTHIVGTVRQGSPAIISGIPLERYHADLLRPQIKCSYRYPCGINDNDFDLGSGRDHIDPAAKVEVVIVDAAGVPVRTLDLGPQQVGVVSLEWDATDDGGRPLPDGAYYVRVSAVDQGEVEVPVGALSYAHVHGVAYAADGLQLDLGLAGNVGLFDIRKIL